MSERPTSATATPAPEQGKVDVARNLEAVMNEIDPTWVETRAAEEKQEKEAAERERASLDRKSLFTRAHSVKDLPPTINSFGSLLNVLPDTGIAYNGKEDFATLMQTFEGADAGKTLDGPAKDVLEYLKSEYWVASLSKSVDFDAFTKKAAFGESPMAGKTEYIIQDIKDALKAESDPEKQKDLKIQLQTMENYAVILNEKGARPHADLIKKYAELVGNSEADPKEIEEAKKLLDTLGKRNIAEGAAYRIISDYFPSDKSYLQDDKAYQPIVTKVPGQQLGEVLTQSQATPATSEAISPQEKVKAELEKSELKTYRSGIAKMIAKRENARLPYGTLDSDIKKGANPIRPKYDATVWRVFAGQNTMPANSPERVQELFKYVVKEAGALERNVNELRKTPRDIDTDPEDSIMPDLTEAIKFAREEMIGKNSDEEIYDYLQEIMHDSFEEIIKAQRSGGKVDSLKSKVQSGSEHVRNVGDKLKSSDKARKVLKIGQGAVKYVVRGRGKDAKSAIADSDAGRFTRLRKNVVESFKEGYRQGRERTLGRAALGRRSSSK